MMSRVCVVPNRLARRPGGPPGRRDRGRRAFSLVELLVVIAIVALLVAVLLPGLDRARRLARAVCVHSDLRQITTALDAYAMNNRDRLPPTRVACGTDVNYQLPIELAEQRYLAPGSSLVPQADLRDQFDPDRTYKYRAPGAVWLNGTFFDDPHSPYGPRALIWVPDDFPHNRSSEGAWYGNRAIEPVSPVTYAVWSLGPNPLARKFPRDEDTGDVVESKFPLPRAYWMRNAGDDGLITHYRSRQGIVRQSP